MSTVIHAIYGFCVLLLGCTVGYPVVIWWLSRVLPRRVCKLPKTPPVTAVMVVHDGASLINGKLANLLELDYPRDCLDLVVVCDGCRDDTARLCRMFSGLSIRVLEFAERRGKALCLNDAFEMASGELVLLTDVFQHLDSLALRELVANLTDPAVGAVSGQLRRCKDESALSQMSACAGYEMLIQEAESRSGSVVAMASELCAIRRDLFRPLPAGLVRNDILISVNIAVAGKRVIFEPLAFAWDPSSPGALDTREGQIRTLAGGYQLLQLAPWLLRPSRNPLWGRLVSHQLLPLLAPWVLILLALSSAASIPHHRIYAGTLLMLSGVVVLAAWTKRFPGNDRYWPIRVASLLCRHNLLAVQALLTFARNRRLRLW